MAELTVAQKEAQEHATKIAQLRFRISRAKAWFVSTDYFPNKVVRGEWAESDPKFVAYKKEAKVQAAIIEDSETEIEALKKARREKITASK